MTGCGCHLETKSREERNVLIVALILNATMFVIGITAGVLAQSTGLIADSLDMLADASAYAIGLFAIGGSKHFKTKAAKLSGLLLLVLGVSMLIEIARRMIAGSEPKANIMMIIAFISLVVNIIVLRLLGRFRGGEAHLHAAWVFTRADVIANVGVIFSAMLILFTKTRFPDLIIGFLISAYVIKEAFEIFRYADKDK